MRTKPLTLLLGLALLAACSSTANAMPQGTPPITTFRGYAPGLKISLSVSEGHIFYLDTHARVSCANGSEHWQLIAEGIPLHRIGIHRDGRFRYHGFTPEEGPISTLITPKELGEDIEEGLSAPPLFEALTGRARPSSVVGRFRAWEGAAVGGHRLHSRCGTRTPEGRWVKFVAHRVSGPPLLSAR
jgi:hypothetical protein